MPRRPIVNTVLKETRERMQKSFDAFESHIAGVRTGRANPAQLNRIHVNYYGSNTPLNQVANVSSPDARTLVVTPFDKSVIADIEKAILESDMGYNPNNRGDAIYITVPQLNDERRRDLVKTVKQMAEEARVAVRNVRRDSNDELRMMEQEAMISEDELRTGENDVQKVTDEFIQRIEQRTKTKEEDIMAV